MTSRLPDQDSFYLNRIAPTPLVPVCLDAGLPPIWWEARNRMATRGVHLSENCLRISLTCPARFLPANRRSHCPLSVRGRAGFV